MIKKFLIVLLISLIACNIYAFVFPEAKVILDNNVVDIGSNLKVKFEITVPPFLNFLEDEDSMIIEGWDIKNVSFKKNFREKGKYVVEADIVTYDPSIKQIPPVKFFCMNKDFGYDEDFAFFSDATPVTVNNIFGNSDFDDIRDIKKPKSLLISKIIYSFIILFVIFVILVIYRKLYFVKFEKGTQMLSTFSIKETVLGKINRLLIDKNYSSDFQNKENIKKYYFSLSAIFREFILKMQNVNVQMTTDEIIDGLQKENNCFFMYREEIEKLLKKYDYMKYSGKIESNEDFADVFDYTKSIIEKY